MFETIATDGAGIPRVWGTGRTAEESAEQAAFAFAEYVDAKTAAGIRIDADSFTFTTHILETL